MKTIQLYKAGKSILGSDGIMYVDGRFGARRIKEAIKERNNRFRINFPELVADSYVVLKGRLGDGQPYNITEI